MNKKEKPKFERTFKFSKAIETEGKKISTEFIIIKKRDDSILLVKNNLEDSSHDANYSKREYNEKDKNCLTILNLVSNLFDRINKLELKRIE